MFLIYAWKWKAKEKRKLFCISISIIIIIIIIISRNLEGDREYNFISPVPVRVFQFR